MDSILNSWSSEFVLLFWFEQLDRIKLQALAPPIFSVIFKLDELSELI